MKKFDYPVHHVENVWSAIELAEDLKKSGEYDLFRGQRHTYPIQPTASRPGADRLAAEAQLNDFASWVHDTPDLGSLHGNINAILAVAQHYGFATPLLDFSRSPKIAGFFASDRGEDGDTGTIICLKKSRFIKSWGDLNKKYFEDKGKILTEIISIDVRNLWRLQAQEGEFLRCNIDPSLLEMFSFFLHIHFPQKSGILVMPRGNIYPAEKSHLEVLLDQYRLINSYPERAKNFELFFGKVISISEDAIKGEVASYFKNSKLPEDHESWSSNSAVQWIEEPEEHYLKDVTKADAQLILPTLTNPSDLEAVMQKQLMHIFPDNESKKRVSFNWSVVDEKGLELYATGEEITNDAGNEFINFKVSEMVSAIYSGMRYLPYENAQIVRALVRYFTMLSFDVYQIIDDCEGVEFSGGSVRGRGFASRQRIREALRDDFFEIIEPTKLDTHGQLDFRDTLFSARFVRCSYKFDDFLKLFVEDLIPSQAVIAVEGLVIGVNPMRIDVLGES